MKGRFRTYGKMGVIGWILMVDQRLMDLGYFNKRRFIIEKGLFSPRIIICVPFGLTQVEEKSCKRVGMSAGAREVYLIEEPMVQQLGAGISRKEANWNLVVEYWGGTPRIGVTSLGRGCQEVITLELAGILLWKFPRGIWRKTLILIGRKSERLR